MTGTTMMITDPHPITPPPELMQQWGTEHYGDSGGVLVPSEIYIATKAARWGADMELDACCEWLEGEIGAINPSDLRAARRPKPQSLAEEALKEVGAFEGMGTCDLGIIRRALERLQELEGRSDN